MMRSKREGLTVSNCVPITVLLLYIIGLPDKMASKIICVVSWLNHL